MSTQHQDSQLSLWRALALIILSSFVQALFPQELGPSPNARRAIPNAPNGYAPARLNCHSNRPIVRDAMSLSSQEVSWLPTRRNNTVKAMQDLLGRLNITNFDAQAYIESQVTNASNIPNIAIAASGGGYRAMLSGGGILQAFDSRSSNSTSAGQLGGLLQSSTYLTGLSGGSWLVGSLYINNYTTIRDIVNGSNGVKSSLWQLDDSILEGPGNQSSYWRQLINAVNAKEDAGFETSIVDYWGRALSYQLINASEGGIAYTWSSIALQKAFIDGAIPLPIVLCEERAPGQMLIPPNTTVYEFNPWEFGSFDPTTNGFVPLEFLGSNFSAGTLPDNQQCVRGFDNSGYVMGTSSSLFNQFLLQINNTDIPNFVKEPITSLLTKFGANNADIATYTPNPFFQWNPETNLNAQSKTLFLVDGGEDLQNIPLHPVIQPARHVDVIFAIDSSADTTTYWPNGTSMVAVYQRSLHPSGIANGTTFPTIPDVNSFVNLGLNSKPTFFGCISSNQTNTMPTPLIAYLPNSPYSFNSNLSTFKLSYTDEERDAVILNGYNVATMANGSRDAEWPACVGCAILSRSLERTGTRLPDVCQTCFGRYCWDGTLNTTTPSVYEPEMFVKTMSGAVSSSRPVCLPLMFLTIGFAILF